jgi:hypothetical protein
MRTTRLSMRSLVATAAVLVLTTLACTLWTGAARGSSIFDKTSAILAQLGARQSGQRIPTRLEVGQRITGVIVEPARLAKFGLAGLGVNDQVVIEAVGPGQIRVTRSVLLKQDAAGSLTLAR